MTAAAHSSRPAHRGIASSRLKTGVFVMTGANSMATTYFFYYIYFYTQDQFGFGQLQNFQLAAALGAVYAVFAFCAGRFAQRAGYFASLRLGLGLMAAAILLGSQMQALGAALALIVAANIGMSFTWLSLESLMSEGETRARLQGLVGIYNATWAVAGALAYCTGGAMQKSWGRQSLFFVPAGLLFLEMIFSLWLEKQVNNQPPVARDKPGLPIAPAAEGRASPVSARTFLKMAWLANPLAYLAINTIIATIPTLARHFQLSEALAGVVCSLWLFSRAGAFLLLRLWPGWHYRFRFLAGAFVVMILCFGGMLLASALWVLVISQAVLGLSFGLIYYSSLFYSMDVGETKGEHAGIHEAVIGAGTCGGPALAAAALLLFPAHPSSGALAVCLLLLCGLGGLFWLRYRRTEA
ncbi:MAG: MFS transporter [Verrucomicrobiota bacterium]|jgi:MFS family permease